MLFFSCVVTGTVYEIRLDELNKTPPYNCTHGLSRENPLSEVIVTCWTNLDFLTDFEDMADGEK